MQIKHKIRIVIDVNLWVSFAIAKGIKSRFEEILLNSRITIVSSNDLIEELTKVLNYPKISKLTKNIENYSSQRFIELHKRSTIIYETKETINISPDPKDNYLISIADSAKAHYLVTGDKPHLLSLKKYKSTKIISFTEFYKILSQEYD